MHTYSIQYRVCVHQSPPKCPTKSHSSVPFAISYTMPRSRFALAMLGLAARGLATSVQTSAVTVARKQLTLEAADAMASAAIAEAKAKQFKPISVSVIDAAGRELVRKVNPMCPGLIPALASAKAGAAIDTHSNTRALKDKYLPDRLAQLVAMSVVSAASQPHNFIAVPGGVLCRDADGDVIGAIGVSGATADEDEHCAIVGAAAVGLISEPAKSQLA